MLKVIAESDLEDARKANWLIRPLGAAKSGLQLGVMDAPVSGLPAMAGAAVWRASHFHLYLTTVVCLPVQDAGRILVVSASYKVRNS